MKHKRGRKPEELRGAGAAAHALALGVGAAVALGRGALAALPQQLPQRGPRGRRRRAAEPGAQPGEPAAGLLVVLAHLHLLHHARLRAAGAVPAAALAAHRGQVLTLEDRAQGPGAHARGAGRPLHHAVLVEDVVRVHARALLRLRVPDVPRVAGLAQVPVALPAVHDALAVQDAPSAAVTEPGTGRPRMQHVPLQAPREPVRRAQLCHRRELLLERLQP
mmetsp:Transcript_59377/g.173688  ORF Transcript_59377/g.173688 Transcript_59377/m.173688 type:complete len:220 (-) Transcript_59377:460-1119(-)